jgi:choline dehydrogenase-like flavoprotein
MSRSIPSHHRTTSDDATEWSAAARYFPITEPAGERYLPFYGSGHIVGTHRMGPRGSSVTDSYMRSWDHQNLFVMGSGSFPTIGTANPSLTLIALVFRSLEVLERELQPVPLVAAG